MAVPRIMPGLSKRATAVGQAEDLEAVAVPIGHAEVLEAVAAMGQAEVLEAVRLP